MNEAFERISLEQAYECALTKATQLYLDGKNEYVVEQYYRGQNGEDYQIVIQSNDLSTVSIYVRFPAYPEGDMGWHAVSFSTDFIVKETLLNAMYHMTLLLDA